LNEVPTGLIGRTGLLHPDGARREPFAPETAGGAGWPHQTVLRDSGDTVCSSGSPLPFNAGIAPQECQSHLRRALRSRKDFFGTFFLGKKVRLIQNTRAPGGGRRELEGYQIYPLRWILQREVGQGRNPGRSVEGGRPRALNKRGHDVLSFVKAGEAAEDFVMKGVHSPREDANELVGIICKVN
jgi:hypothetical protein